MKINRKLNLTRLIVRKNKVEIVICSAIWYKDLPLVKNNIPKSLIYPKNVDRGLVFCGHRHPHCQYSMIAITGKRSVTVEVGEYIQGFLTNFNRFVDREEGAKIALASGQIDKLNYSSNELYSEDLY